jgi:hypothetical protein
MDNRDFIRKMMDAVDNVPVSEEQVLNEAQITVNIDGPEADEFLSRLLDLSGQHMLQPVDMEPMPASDLGMDVPVVSPSDSRYVCDACGESAAICACQQQEGMGAVCEVCGLTEDMCECDISISKEGPLLGATMEAAEYDHGHDEVDDEGGVVDPNTYIYKPDQVPQRLSKPGDNPMVSEEAMVRYKQLVNEYVDFISESNIPNEDGSMSPLTSADREEFDKDPSAGEEAKTDGSMSPMSTIKRQAVMK